MPHRIEQRRLMRPGLLQQQLAFAQHPREHWQQRRRVAGRLDVQKHARTALHDRAAHVDIPRRLLIEALVTDVGDHADHDPIPFPLRRTSRRENLADGVAAGPHRARG